MKLGATRIFHGSAALILGAALPGAAIAQSAVDTQPAPQAAPQEHTPAEELPVCPDAEADQQAAASKGEQKQQQEKEAQPQRPPVQKEVGAAAGGTVGQIAGAAVGGPVGAAVGGVVVGRVGEAIGGLFKKDKKDKDGAKAKDEPRQPAECVPAAEEPPQPE